MDRAPTIARLDEHRAALSEAMLKLNAAGLDDYPAAHMCRHYLAKVKWAIGEARHDRFDALAGIVGENGWGPGIRSTLQDAAFELRTLAPVTVLQQTATRGRVAA